MTANNHAKILGAIFLVFGLLGVLAIFGILIFLLGMGGIAVFNTSDGDSIPIVIMLLIFAGFALFSGFFVIPQLIAGWSLLKGNGKSKIMVIISSIINIMNFPLGTIVGVYALWFTFGDEGKQYFR